MENWEILSKIRQRLDSLHRERSAIGHKINKRDAQIYQFTLSYLETGDEKDLNFAQTLKAKGSAETEAWLKLTADIKQVEALLK